MSLVEWNVQWKKSSGQTYSSLNLFERQAERKGEGLKRRRKQMKLLYQTAKKGVCFAISWIKQWSRVRTLTEKRLWFKLPPGSSSPATVYPGVQVFRVTYAMPSHGTTWTNSVKQELFAAWQPFPSHQVTKARSWNSACRSYYSQSHLLKFVHIGLDHRPAQQPADKTSSHIYITCHKIQTKSLCHSFPIEEMATDTLTSTH